MMEGKCLNIYKFAGYIDHDVTIDDLLSYVLLLVSNETVND